MIGLRKSNAVSPGRLGRPATGGAEPLASDDVQAQDAGPLGERRTVLGRGERGLLAPLGRIALWAFVGLVLVRGVGAILGSGSAADRGPGGPAQNSRFPDPEARAFAVRFARAYLTFSPKRPEAYRRAVASYFSDDLSDQAAAVLPPRGPGARIAWATVAREAFLGSSRALITVATASTAGAVRYLSVPVARDRAGGLVVFDLPAFSAPPAKGTASVPESVTLTGPEAQPIEDLAKRFLTAYLQGGDRGALRYFLAPGARVVLMPESLAVVGVDQITRDDPPSRDGLVVVASVRVRDRASGAVLALRYRLSLLRRERWYVRAVAGGPSV